jgi:hypothetical protein
MVEIRNIMSEETPKWEKTSPNRGDMQSLLKNTKKFAEMYLKIVEEKKTEWENHLEAQIEKDKQGSNG